MAGRFNIGAVAMTSRSQLDNSIDMEKYSH
jgi:hypothetical protein